MAAKTFEDFLITWCKFLVATSRYPKVELITKAFSPSDGKILGNNGKILTCWSTCMSGPSHCCNHVITCIYKIEHPNTHGYTNLSCTSTACAWNKSTIKVIEPKRNLWYSSEETHRIYHSIYLVLSSRIDDMSLTVYFYKKI